MSFDIVWYVLDGCRQTRENGRTGRDRHFPVNEYQLNALKESIKWHRCFHVTVCNMRTSKVWWFDRSSNGGAADHLNLYWRIPQQGTRAMIKRSPLTSRSLEQLKRRKGDLNCKNEKGKTYEAFKTLRQGVPARDVEMHFEKTETIRWETRTDVLHVEREWTVWGSRLEICSNVHVGGAFACNPMMLSPSLHGTCSMTKPLRC